MSFLNRVNEPAEERRSRTPPLPFDRVRKRVRLRQNITYGLYQEADDPYYSFFLHREMELPTGTVLNVVHDVTESDTLLICSVWINGVRQNVNTVRYIMIEMSVEQDVDPQNRRFVRDSLNMTPMDPEKYEVLDNAEQFANLRI